MNPAMEPKPVLAATYYRVVIDEISERETIERPWLKRNDDDKDTQQYQYQPKIGKEQVKREVLRAELPAIDLKAVVKAVHGL